MDCPLCFCVLKLFFGSKNKLSMPEDPKWIINALLRHKYNTRHGKASRQNGVAMLLKLERNSPKIFVHSLVNTTIIICYALLHNLKNVTIEIPKNQHIVITWNYAGSVFGWQVRSAGIKT
ncbi:MAG: hypothetical protein IPG80_00225 [Anaerolineales bacterium]|uniref:hypothetical protein n=1 Tax=Candidatus Villigracilis vicinus TaxID=3140679 RepID=UPI0031370477|nr:hypothetical protein [Anaerolineales bacterium]